MGQKVNPNGLRLGVNKTWQSQCLSDIKENKQFIGDNWYIEDYEK